MLSKIVSLKKQDVKLYLTSSYIQSSANLTHTANVDLTTIKLILVYTYHIILFLSPQGITQRSSDA